MDLREKLIGLIQKGARGHTFMPTETIANYLVEHGVTVKDWISVAERLPEKGLDVLLYFGYKYKNQAVGFWIGSEEDNAVFWRAYTDDGFYTDCDYKPTHWMPLPQTPKGD